MGLRFALAVVLTLAGCGPSATRPSTPPAMPPPQGGWLVSRDGAPIVTQAAAPAPASIYTADEAVRDALASPLALVGVGGWTGYFRHLSCIYRNEQVIVVDMRCNRRETYQFEVIIESPARGLVEIVADGRQKTVPLSTVPRADYETFEVSGTGPWAGPPQLALGMSYDEITAYDELRSRAQGGCELTIQIPQAVCSHGAPFTPAAFAAAHARFFEAPPDGWYRLVGALVAERAQSYAATDLGKVSVKQLAAWGAAIGFQNDIDVTEDMVAFVGQGDHFAAVVVTEDGGMAYVGTRRGVQVVVARTDRTGATRWESVLSEPGNREEGDTSLVASKDGFFVHAAGYVDPGQKARHRLVKLDARGKVQWKWAPPNRGPIQIPQFFRAQLTPQGTVGIDGYIQLEKDGPVRGWTAEVSADGKTLHDEVGSVELGERNSKP
jgi:hypothetical protein